MFLPFFLFDHIDSGQEFWTLFIIKAGQVLAQIVDP
jgi:hypothetical protein